jgi:hypothetical protein
MTLPSWSERPPRTAALNGWLAREDAVAAGAALAVDPVRLGLPDRETLLRALFHRFATTLEGALDAEPQLVTAPYAALVAAYRKAAAHRPADWRTLQREAGDPVVAELTRRQQARLAHRAGVSQATVATAAGHVAQGHATLGHVSRARRRRTEPRVLARRGG